MTVYIDLLQGIFQHPDAFTVYTEDFAQYFYIKYEVVYSMGSENISIICPFTGHP